MPAVQERVQAAHRQGAPQGRQPGRGRRHRRGHPGGRAGRRGQGRPAARRHPAVAGHRDQGRRVHPAHRAQHHHPDAQERDLLHRGGQPVAGRDPRAAGRARDGQLQQDPRASSSSSGIPPAPRGIPQIEVTFDIDANGIVNVSAKDLGSGNQQKIRIEALQRPDRRRDQARWCRDAESHADEDKRLRALAEARNNAEARAHEGERQLKEHGEVIDEELKRDLEGAIAAAKEAAQGEDTDDIEAKTAEPRRAAPQVLRAGLPEGRPDPGDQRRRRGRGDRRGRRVRGHRRREGGKLSHEHRPFRSVPRHHVVQGRHQPPVRPLLR